MTDCHGVIINPILIILQTKKSNTKHHIDNLITLLLKEGKMMDGWILIDRKKTSTRKSG
jgi:hypothetical protein